MNIIVCLKPIRQIYARTSNDVSENFLAVEDEIHRINPYDESALELALKVKEAQPSSKITVVTLGPIIADNELNRSLAFGVDSFIQIDTRLPADEMDSRQKAEYLARAVKEIGADLILCGKESLDRRNGQLAAFLAHRLELPFVSAILELEIDNYLIQAKVTRKIGGGRREVYACDLPALFSVDIASTPLPMPTAQAKSRAMQLPMQVLNYSDQVIQRQSEFIRVFPPKPRPKKVKAPDSQSPAFKRIRQLLEGFHVEKKGTLLTGSPESQADAIISFLQERGLIGLANEHPKEK